MAREIILDVETTGLDPRSGHRVIELACIELVDFMPTGRHFHQLIHPERDIDPDAERVHGISLASLAGKPKFAEAVIVDAFLEFVADGVLVAHNAAFDRGFVNWELGLAGRNEIHESRWVDTLAMARAKFPGAYNSLDALCKRFRISLAEREKHGALIDCKLLAQVYLELSGGKERALDLAPAAVLARRAAEGVAQAAYGARPRPLASRLSVEENAAHEAFIAGVLKDGAVWLKAI
jgi:DNA polymerase-3 subunit epsilon